MKDYYTLKEIILGLRGEQLKIAEKLNELENKLSICDNDKYKNSEFGFNLVNNNAYLVHHLYKKYSVLENILNCFSFKFKEIMNGDKYTDSIRKLGNGDYVISGVSGLACHINEEDQQSFNNLVDDILNDEFINNCIIEIVKYDKWRYINNILTGPIVTTYSGFNNKNHNTLSYLARNDSIDIVKKIDNKSYKDTLNELLSLRYERKYFSEYIQNIIDSNDDIKKDIIISDDNLRGKHINFYLNDEREAFVLVKK